MGFIRRAVFGITPRRLQLPLWYRIQILAGAAEPELLRLQEFVPPNTSAIDVGANIGLYSYALAKLCRRVDAFEPVPGCADILDAYAAPNVRVHRVGLSDHIGEATLSVPIVSGQTSVALATLQHVDGEHKRRKIPITTLDAHEAEGVGFIKIDVEGHEMQVLAGGEGTLARWRPVLLVEIEQRHLPFPMQEVIDWIAAHGYSGRFLYRDVWHDVERFTYEVHQQPYLDDVAAARYRRIRGRYVNNFVFVPRDAQRPSQVT